MNDDKKYEDLYRELREINKSLKEINKRQNENESNNSKRDIRHLLIVGAIFLLILIFHPFKNNDALAIAVMAYLLQLSEYLRR